MTENLIDTRAPLTNKQKFLKLYKENKILIFSIFLTIIIAILSFSFYLEEKDKKRILLADSYIEAKVYLENGDKVNAKSILETIIYANDHTYSTLSLFLLVNTELIKDNNKMISLFEHVLENNKFEKEFKNLIIFKKALFQSSFVNEAELLKTTKTLINTETVWKPHALLLTGDYFLSKKQHEKAKDFYMQILSLKDINKQQEFYDHARSKLKLITNQ